MADLGASQGPDQRQIKLAHHRVRLGQVMEHAIVRDDLRLPPRAEEHLRLIPGIVHVLDDACFIHHFVFQIRRQLAPQLAHQRQQRLLPQQAGHFTNQQVGQQRVLPGEQFAGLFGQLVQLLRASPGGPGSAPLDQAIALQRGQVLAHRRAGDGQGLRQVVDAHARRLVQQRMEQVLLGTAQAFEHQNLSGNCLTNAAAMASDRVRICSRIIAQVRASPT
ncbi:hypothetical protein D3C77_465260 [compost metagenome]